MCTFWSSFGRSKLTFVKLWENLWSTYTGAGSMVTCLNIIFATTTLIGVIIWLHTIITIRMINQLSHGTWSFYVSFFTSNKCDQVMLIFRRWCCRCNMSALLLAIKSGRVPKIKICQARCLSWNQSKTSFKSDLQRSQHCDFLGSPQ